MRVLVVDNYDSLGYNLVQSVREAVTEEAWPGDNSTEPTPDEVVVPRNDEP